MQASFHNLKFQKKKLVGLVIKQFAFEDKKKVIGALAFAVQKHKGQRRDEGKAYVIHPIRVAVTLLDDVGTWDADIIVSALLHDVVEDCKVRITSIEARFGKRVAHFVQQLTRKSKKGETDPEKEKRKIQKLDQLEHAVIEVQLVKCADILDNLRCAADVPFWAWTTIARKKFPRWRREFHVAARFASRVHPVLASEIRSALRAFEVKRIVRGIVRLGL